MPVERGKSKLPGLTLGHLSYYNMPVERGKSKQTGSK